MLSEEHLEFIRTQSAKANMTPEEYLNSVVKSHIDLLARLSGRGLDCTPKVDG